MNLKASKEVYMGGGRREGENDASILYYDNLRKERERKLKPNID